MPTQLISTPELLAPAGSLEAFFAAMESGADAVYCGLKDFSARAKAKNFSGGDLERMLAYARAHGKRLYVTVNTLVKEDELPQLCETLALLEALQVDGVILQDPAVWRLGRRHFPNLPLHASTQMTIHNVAGVRMLERLGFSRGVLARELSLAEIAAIRRETTLELEHFIHGALCYCFSGQCFFSSWLGGKSGNRGRCAQPCRRRYRYRREEGYYFSPNDLSAIELLPELAAAGVCSFKIEGRMKSAEYVASVVSAYRTVLDARAADRPAAVKAAKERLKLSFGRSPTKGFLAGGDGADMVVASQTGATGRFLGEVLAVRGGALQLKTRDRIHLGDRLRVQPKSDQAGSAFTVKELFLGRQPVKVVSAGSQVTIPSPFAEAVRVGDAVFKVSSEQAFTLSEAACRRRLEGHRTPPLPATVQIALADDVLSVTGRAGGAELRQDYPVTTFPADGPGLDRETLHKVFAATAETPLTLAALETGPLPAVVIPPSRLKEIRRDFYRRLADAALAARAETRRAHLQQALADLLSPQPLRPARGRQLAVVLGSLRDAHLLSDAAVDQVVIPLTAGNLQELGPPGRRLAGREAKVVWDLPFILFDPEWRGVRDVVRELHRRGYRHFRLNNLGHLPLFDGLDGLQLSSGYRLFSLNSQARLAWRELGLQETTLYLEDDRANLQQILARDAGIEAALTVYAPVALLTSRIPLKGLRSDTPVVSDRGEGYRVERRDGLTVVRAESDFSLLSRLAELQSFGLGRFVVDLSHLGPFTPRGRAVLDALRQGQDPAGTSPFNYEHGLE